MSKKLLSIVEMGGYPNFTPLYESLGFEVQVAHQMRKVLKILKKEQPDVIVTEFNYQTDFRDRSSTLESLMASLQWGKDTKVIVLYDREWREKLDRFLQVYPVFAVVPFPVEEAQLKTTLLSANASTRN